MPDSAFNPRRFFLKLAAGTGFSALAGAGTAQAFLGGANQFDWLPTECADRRYPMQLVSGILFSGDEPFAEVPAGKLINNGWGEIGSVRVVGAVEKPIPERLKIAWFSFAEDTFYAGTVALPKAELTRLFADGFAEPLTQARATFHKIVFGMGLGGWLSVWVAGSGVVREVISARLPPAELDWKRVLDNPAIPRAEYVRSKLQARLSREDYEALVKQGPPVAAWPRYAQRDRWRLAVSGAVTPQHIFVRSFNGERQFHDLSRPLPDALESLPRHAQLTCQSPSGSKWLVEVRFDEAEILGAFDRAKAGAAPVTLKFDIDARARAAIEMVSPAGSVKLQKARVDVSSLGK